MVSRPWATITGRTAVLSGREGNPKSAIRNPQLEGRCMALMIVFGFASLVTGLVLGTWNERQEQQRLFLAELRTGEVQIGGWWFRVRAVECPELRRANDVAL
jgi:hypothetical protein